MISLKGMSLYIFKYKPNKLWADQEREFYNNLMQNC